MPAIYRCLAMARHRCYGQQNEQDPRGAASIHVRVARKQVYEYRGSELARMRIEGASILVRVTGVRVRWDEERGSKYARTSDRFTGLRAYLGEQTSASPA
jgi:hypothetical protein